MPIDPDVQTELDNINAAITVIQTDISNMKIDISNIQDTLENHEERIANNEAVLIGFFGEFATGLANSFPELNEEPIF